MFLNHVNIFLLSIFLIINLNINPVKSGLIILNFKQQQQQQHNSDALNELQICAIKKEISKSGQQDNDKEFNLVYLNNEDACEPFDNADPLINKSAVYLHTPKTNCPFTQMAKNIQEKSPKLVLIGSNGPIVSLFYHKRPKTSFYLGIQN
jgi:hypothetical protein